MDLHRRTMRRFGLVAVVTGTAIAVPTAAHAGVQACRVDPIIWINAASSSSSGSQYKLVVTATINDTASNLRIITYTIHAPAGTSVASINYTGGALQSKETIAFKADNQAATFAVTTNATTYATAGNGLTVTEMVSHPGFSSHLTTAQMAGIENQDLMTSVVQN